MSSEHKFWSQKDVFCDKVILSKVGKRKYSSKPWSPISMSPISTTKQNSTICGVRMAWTVNSDLSLFSGSVNMIMTIFSKWVWLWVFRTATTTVDVFKSHLEWMLRWLKSQKAF